MKELISRDANQLLGRVTQQVAGGLGGIQKRAVAGMPRDQVGGAFRQPLVVALLLFQGGIARL